jgi:peptide/nickel transport system permease protein
MSIGGTIVTIAILVAVLAPLLTPYDPLALNVDNALQAPSLHHPFGTDQFGRDVLSRTMFAARLDLTIAFVGTVLPFVLGVSLGLLSGYFGGWADTLIGRLVDVIIAFPGIVLIIAFIALLGNNLINLFLALTLTDWTNYTRLTRGEVLFIKDHQFVQATRSLGYTHMRILLRHIVPNVITSAIIFLMLDMVGTILLVTSLSYIGLGPPPPTPEWGAMIAEARPFIFLAWWIPVFPGLAIIFTGFGLAVFGDGLADHLRPEGG